MGAGRGHQHVDLSGVGLPLRTADEVIRVDRMVRHRAICHQVAADMFDLNVDSMPVKTPTTCTAAPVKRTAKRTNQVDDSQLSLLDV